MADVAEQVKTIIAQKLRVDTNKVTESAHFVNDLGADSLDRAEIVMALETAFDCEIPEDESAKLATVGSVVEFIEKAAA